MKDIFKLAGLESMGIGGMNCPCCNSFRGGRHRKKLAHFSRLRRSRLKQLMVLDSVSYTSFDLRDDHNRTLSSIAS